MKPLLLLNSLLTFHVIVSAQFIYNPFPLQQSDFAKINQHKYPILAQEANKINALGPYWRKYVTKLMLLAQAFACARI